MIFLLNKSQFSVNSVFVVKVKMYYFKNECEGFIRFPNTRKHLKPRGCRPSGFIVFKHLET